MESLTLVPSRRPGLPTIVQPLHGGYDTARAAWNLTADQRPAGVAVATTVEQVRETIALAQEHELKVAAQGTGHLATALPSLERALLLKTALHDGEVEIDPVNRRARVKAGAVWEEVVAAAAEHGLACLHGSSPDVGVMGYTLGGGMSFYGRRYGVAANHVHAIEVVTADGELRRVDGQNDPDLFWALRGGGGAFGVVTAIEIELFPIETIYAGTLFWPIGAGRDVLRAWVDWTRDAPDAITTSFRILCLPPLPEVPEPLRATPVVAIDGVLLGDAADGAEVLAPLRAAAPTMIDGWAEMPAAAAVRVHGDPEQPVPGMATDAMLGELDDAAIDAFIGVAGEGSGSPLLAAELRQLGGAFAHAPAGAGVTGSIDGSYAQFGVGLPMTPELGVAVAAHLPRYKEAMAPWSTGRQYLNFAEHGGSAEPCFAPVAYERLRQTRRAWDPDELFVSSHRIS